MTVNFDRHWCPWLLVALMAAPAAGAPDREARRAEWCGTDDARLEQALAAHQYNERRDRRRSMAATAAGRLGPFRAADVRKEGNVAVVVDDGRIIRDRNLVDLANQGLNFKYKKRLDGYIPRAAGGGVGPNFGEKLPLADDDTIEIALPFKVEVYGTKYDSLFVNSDGNLTFGESDFASTARDIGRFLDGPPRFAPFFRDLDPEIASAEGGIFALIGDKSVAITWYRVPEFGAADVINTFSVTVFKNGRVLFEYDELESETAIVGLSPGGGSGLELIDYSEELPFPLQQTAVAESFSNELTVDEPALAKVFLEHFEDRYSHLVIYTDFPVQLLGSFGTIAFEQTIKNEVRGIGVGLYDASRFYGSTGALESFVMMGALGQYPRDPEATVFINNVYSAADILMHEIGHRWGVRALFVKDGAVSENLLGRTSVHWSFCFDSDHSYLEGNDIADNGDGSFTTTVGRARYNDLDRYMTGLIGPEEVGDFFLIEGCDGDRAPEANVSLAGTRLDLTIDDVVAALGPRRPAAGDAPTRFDVAFALLVRQGEEPQAGSVSRVDQLRKIAGRRFKEAGGKLVTKLRLR
jgi:hypothetical protein